MKIAIYGNRRQHDHADNIRRLVAGLALEGADVVIHDKLYNHLTGELGLSLPGAERVFDCPANTDLALSLGGDGTFLRTVAWVQPLDLPLLGINTGHLGYLTALTLDEAVKSTSAIVAVDFRKVQLRMLSVVHPDIGEPALALNEVVVSKEDSSSMITADVKLDAAPLAQYKADGLIVATPTGSTAYNLSVGGPIVEPSAPVMVISPIAAHSLTLRPIVVNDTASIDITVDGRGKRFRLVVDGRSHSLPTGASVSVARSERCITVLRRHDRDFASVIADKLGFNG